MQDSETGVVCVKGKAELAASVNAISLRRRGWVGDGESGRAGGGKGGGGEGAFLGGGDGAIGFLLSNV